MMFRKRVISVGILLLCLVIVRITNQGGMYTPVNNLNMTDQMERIKQVAGKVNIGKTVTEEGKIKLESKEKKFGSLDICSSPKYDYENTPLAEYIEGDIAWNEEMSRKMGKSFPLEIDYHLFDFNDDGIEDYLLCESGTLFSGRWGNSVQIFIQKEDKIECVLSMLMGLHHSPSDHNELLVLDEKTNGYYAIVLPESNYILRYDAKTQRYAFGVEEHQEISNSGSKTSATDFCMLSGEKIDTRSF